jgi:signal transduction histidine kinase
MPDESLQARMSALFDLAPIAFAIQEGPELVYTVANRAYRALVGGRDIVGLPRRDVLPDIARASSLLQRVFETGERYVNQELSFRVDRTGQGFVEDAVLSIVIEPLLEGGRVAGLITVAVDVTEQATARRSAQALAADLERAVRARDDFLSVAAHELRTPITALLLKLDHAVRTAERDAGAPDAMASFLTNVRSAMTTARRLGGLVDDLLDSAQLAAGKMRLQATDVDLVALVREVVHRHDEQRARAGCEVTVRAGLERPVGHWDRGRIEQVVTNLLTNALKYGAGLPVEIAVEGSDPVRLSVSDRGIGIQPADQRRIFERFERAASGAFGGLGLGLWIVHEIVAAHGGSVSVASVPGKGATFTVELPCRQLAQPGSGEAG